MKEQTMKKLITLMMTFLLCLGSVAPAFAADKKKGYDAAAKHAIAVEATTGKILYEKDATIMGPRISKELYSFIINPLLAFLF